MSIDQLSLSLSQSDIYFDQVQYPDSPLYTICGYLRFGNIDVGRMSMAHAQVVKAHDAFGLRINNKDENICQYVSDQRTVDLPLVDYSQRYDPQSAALKWLDELITIPITIDNELFRPGLIKLSEDEYWYVICCHHLMMDGRAITNWGKALSEYYHDKQVAPMLSWQDVVNSDENYLSSARYQADKQYWHQYCAKLPQQLLTPKHANEQLKSGAQIINIDAVDQQRLKAFARDNGIGVAHLFLGMLSGYFTTAYQQQDVVFGLPSHNRKGHAQKQMIGVFTSISPMMITAPKQQTFRQLVAAIAANQKQNFRHQRYPLGHLKRDLISSGLTGRVYDIGFNYLTINSEFTVNDSAIKPVYLSNNHEMTPLMVAVREDSEAATMAVHLEYNLAYFDAHEAKLLAARFGHLLNQLLLHPDQPLSKFSILPTAEVDYLRYTLNETAFEHPVDQCLHQLFEAQAERTPQRQALFFEQDGHQTSLSYQQLNQQANQLARYLQTQGVEAQTLVGVGLPRSPQLIVAVLAILKAGGAYLPLDPLYPPQRLAYMIEDSGIHLVIGQQQFAGQSVQTFDLNDVTLQQQLDSYSMSNLDHQGQTSENLAYVIYTSGSTGKPKGAMLEHRSVVNLVMHQQRKLAVTEHSRVLQFASFSFDSAVQEWLMALLKGAALYICNEQCKQSFTDLEDYLLTQQISHAILPPVLLQQMDANKDYYFTALGVGGEAVEPTVAQRWSARYPLFNIYGPTEAAVCCSVAQLKPQCPVTIGQPIDNTQLYVVDKDNKLAPYGVEGELCIGGIGVGRGYHNQPTLSAQSFIVNPLSGDPTDRWYRTGDLVRYICIEGRIELDYRGRIDEQVKLRGYRIEIGEIEHQLALLERVGAVAVMVREDQADDKRLVAYLHHKDKTNNHASNAKLIHDLKRQLKTSLPHFMVPTDWVFVDQLPLTRNGKVDKKALPKPDSSLDNYDYIPANSDSEKALVAMWIELLKLDGKVLSTSADFFTCGGHSLSAMRLVSAIKQRFSINITIEDIFAHPILSQQALLLDQRAVNSVIKAPKIEPLAKPTQALQLSYAQQRLWFINQMANGSSQYNMPAAIEIEGWFDVASAQQAFSYIIERHQPLRTVFANSSDDGGTVQIIRESFDFKLQVIDLQNTDFKDKSEAEQAKELEQLRLADSMAPFDLTKDLMLRVSYIRLSGSTGILLLNMHHIACDGWSVDVIISEFKQFYQALVNGGVCSLPQLELTYSDYAQWQRQFIDSGAADEQLAYWDQQLANLPQVHSFPLDRPRPAEQGFNGATTTVTLDINTLNELKQLALSNQVTLFMLLQGAFSLLLSRYSNNRDIVVGTFTANRMEKQFEQLVGFFTNTLVLRVDCDPDIGFIDYLNQVKTVNLGAQRNQDVPFEHLVDRLNPHRSPRFAPLVQVMFNLNENKLAHLQLPDARLTPLPKQSSSAKFELLLEALETQHGLELCFEYNTDLFDAITIEQLARHLIVLLQGINQNSTAKLADLPLLDINERQHMFKALNDTQVDFPTNKCLHQLFIEQVLRRGDEIAIIDAKGQLSYNQLFRRAYGLAQTIEVKGSLIGVLLPKGSDQVIATLAILMSGNAYLPLELSWPEQRRERVLEHAKVAMVITEKQLLVEPFTGDIVNAIEQFNYLQSAEDLAYVIFTSGSTGTPKGVAIEHQAAVNTLFDINQTMAVTEHDRVLAVSALSFDLSVYDIFGVLGCGGIVVMPEHERAADPQHWAQLVSTEQVTLFNAVPISAQLLVEQFEWQPRATSLRIVMMSGDWVPVTLPKRLWQQFAGVETFSLGGATEASIWSIIYPIVEDTSNKASVPYGKPMANQQFFVLDSQLNPCPTGVTGQLHIGGVGVAQCYLNDPMRTTDSFIKHPELAAMGLPDRLYKTGDLGRYLNDGNIEFIGRMDDQVKLNGFRIELGEIAYQLEQLPEVDSAIALVREDQPGQQRLVAYVTSKEEQNITDLLTTAAKSSLPEYMVPAAFVVLEHLPLTANGKVDKKALPQPAVADVAELYVKPQSPTEIILADIWSDLLAIDRDKISATVNFFAAGGDSILSIQMVARAIQRGLQLSVKQLFDHQSIAQLALHLSQNSHTDIVAAPQSAVIGTMPLLPIQQWFFDDPTEVSHFNQSVLLTTPNSFEPSILTQIVEKLFQRHDALRLRFKRTDGQNDESWSATYQSFDQSMVNESIDYITLDSADFSGINIEAEKVQTSLSLTNGPLFKAVFFSNNSNEGRLLLVIHHLVVDGISWRILLSDLHRLCTDPNLTLAAKTSSYRQWAEFLVTYAHSDTLEAEREYWLGQDAVKPVTTQNIQSAQSKASKSNTPKLEVTCFELSKQTTEQLLHQTGVAYRTQTIELLLAALAMAHSRWTGESSLTIDMEGHGREPLNEALDLTQTVGWFTSIYPFKISINHTNREIALAELICTVKELYRAIPNKGIGFGILKYLAKDSDIAKLQTPQILFNYLGQFDSIIDQHNGQQSFALADEPRGTDISPQRKLSHALMFNGLVKHGKLQFELSYDSALYQADKLAVFCDYFVDSVEAIIKHCLSAEAGRFTPSDFSLPAKSKAQLDKWQSQYDIETIYQATPMQQGLLFHSEMHRSAYTTQILLTLSDIDSDLFYQAWQQLLSRHAILRTAFVNSGDAMMQLVLKSVQLPWHYVDLTSHSAKAQSDIINTYREQDKQQGFDMAQAPLMRFTFWQLTDGQCKLLWSHHHAMLDGWCLPLLLSELSQSYQALRKGKPCQLPSPQPYQHYINWLQTQDLDKALSFWQQELTNISTPQRLLPHCNSQSLQAPSIDQQQAEISLSLSEEQTSQLQHLARRCHTTVNILLQGAWACLLSRYTNRSSVVFGTTVAGRPADLAGVEQMIGLFINTIPVKVDVATDMPLHEWLGQLHQGQVNRDQFNFVSLADIQRVIGQAELFNTLLVFENYPADHALSELNIKDIEGFEGSNYDLSLIASLTDKLKLKLSYQTSLYQQPAAEQVLQHLEQLLLNMLTHGDGLVKTLPMLTDEQQHHLVNTLNDSAASHPIELCIDQLFEQQVTINPQRLAVSAGPNSQPNEQMSYDQLNQQANQLGAYLRAQGVKPDTIVAVCLERSAKMIMTLMAILKAGGAYLPMDSNYPTARLNNMIEDSEVTYLISETGLIERHGLSVNHTVLLDEPAMRQQIQAYPLTNLAPLTGRSSNDLAYVIYTSGSTGQPKGVLLEHRGAVNMAYYLKRVYDLSASSTVLQIASMSFDAATAEWLLALLGGAGLYICDDNCKQSIEQLQNFIQQTQISHAILPPALLQQMDSDIPYSLQSLSVAGEACEPALAQRWLSKYRFFNGYGPTENTVCACVAELKPNQGITIGRAMDNAQLYVLDSNLRLAPPGAIGELYIAGVGVARGYLNRPELSAQRFITNPLEPDSDDRWYRTGDLVRYLDNDQLAFVGRVDEQLNIRGFRVEAGEIEYQLCQHPLVTSALVVSIDDKRLVAYVVGQSVVGNINDEQLREFLTTVLPKHMIPHAFVLLERFELTVNGKIDKSKLPSPDEVTGSTTYCAPQSDIERTLVKIWSELLSVEAAALGVNANFFTLGGDSILSLQVVSRAAQAGLTLTVKQLFDNPTIAQLAHYVKPTASVVSQSAVSGPLTLLPVQRMFFADDTDLDHFNQALLFTTPISFKPQMLSTLAQQLLHKHDALRLRFTFTQQQWTARHQAFDESMVSAAITIIDNLTQVDDVQTSLCISEGPLFKLAYVEPTDTEQGRLLLVFHHLVVDGVSWRILLQDIELLCQQISQSKPPQLTPKTSSYQQWGAFLAEYSQSETLMAEMVYWQNTLKAEVMPLPQKVDAGTGQDHFDCVKITLDSNSTEQLLHRALPAYRSQINELLLSGLWLGFNQWSGSNRFRVDIESHGREALSPNIDLSQTVGWFTSVYPLLLDCSNNKVDDVICGVKESYRAVPNHGIGYGVLKYLTSDSDTLFNTQLTFLKELQTNETATILFNYLGQLDNLFSRDTYLKSADESVGQSVSPRRMFTHDLNFNGWISAGQLTFDLKYNSNLYDESQIKRLSECIVSGLQQVIRHCIEPNAGRLTPADFPLAKVNQSQLDNWQQRYPGAIADIYPATPMQQGLLFHSQLDKSAYVTQLMLTFDEGIDLGKFKAAWQHLVNRHDIFRTLFLSDDSTQGQSEHMLQVILQSAQLPWNESDFSHLSKTEQTELIESYRLEDKQQGFNQQQPPLMRISVWHLGESRYKVLWSNHHALTDGWCLPLIYTEIAQSYEALVKAQPIQLPAPRAYRDYIAWLNSRDMATAKAYWQAQLADIDGPTPLPTVATNATSSQHSHQQKSASLWLQLNESDSNALVQLAKASSTTVNTLLQGAWALLLGRYSNRQTVVFGTTVAGRPPELAGVEQTIGLFINTLPVRVEIDFDKPLMSWLQQLHQAQVERDQHAFLGLNEISSGADLFDSLVVFENYPTEKLNGELTISASENYETNSFAISLIASLGTTLDIEIQYQCNSFDDVMATQLQRHLHQLLKSMLQHPHSKLADLAMMTEDELNLRVQQQLEQGLVNDSIYRQFETVAQQTPENIALVFEQRKITYGQLNQQANQLAHYLREQGVGPNALVGLCIERSPTLIIGLLAILKAGGAYVPLDAEYPPSRLQYIINDSGIKLLLSGQNLPSLTLDSAVTVLPIDTLQTKHYPTTNLVDVVEQNSTNLAYVIYTSGSTGQPKGVMVEHRNLQRLFSATGEQFNFNASDVWTLFHSCAFDFSVWEIWGALAHGASLVIVPQSVTRATDDFYQLLVNEQVTVLNQTPSAFSQLSDVDQKHQQALALRLVIFGGEALEPAALQNWLTLHGDDSPQLVNMYGITETTVHVTSRRILAADIQGNKGSLIGNSLADLSFYLLDHNLTPVPIGGYGEIFVGGAGVARGYLNREDLTQARFINDPFNPGERLYRTGDLARYLADGEIEYLGRTDEQVKIRGFRIELGEIQNQLLLLPEVKTAHVIVLEGQYLVAYLTVNDDIQSSELRTKLTALLPAHMIPAHFVVLDNLPLTHNGKLDKKALPRVSVELSGQSYIKPKSKTEQELAQIWARLLQLQLEQVSASANFFALGGHSLLSVRLASAIESHFGVELAISDIFKSAQLTEMAAVIDSVDAAHSSEQSRQVIVTARTSNQLPVSFAQQRLWFIDQIQPGSTQYHMPAVLQVSGNFDIAAAQRAFSRIIARHEPLRTVFVNGEGTSDEGTSAQQANGQGDVSQLIHDKVDFTLKVIDLTHLSGQQQVQAQQLAIESELGLTFDLSQDLMLRATYIHLSDEQGILLLNVHHIACDGWSMGLLQDEFICQYQAVRNGKPDSMPALAVQYADYAQWQIKRLQGEYLEQQVSYWQNLLAGIAPVHSLPLDHPRPALRGQQIKGASYTNTIKTPLVQQLKAFSQAQQATLFMTLQTAFALHLGRWSRETDIVMGTPIAGRSQQSLEPLIGLFLNTQILRTQFDHNPNFVDLLAATRATFIEGNNFNEVPFELLVERLNPPRSLSHTPIFQILINMDNTDIASQSLADIQMTPMDQQFAINNKFDITLYIKQNRIKEQSSTIDFDWTYDSSLFSHHTINLIADQFIELLAALMEQPKLPVLDHPWQGAQQWQTPEQTFMPQAAQTTKATNVVELFELQVQQKPWQSAVEFGPESISYQQLNQQVNRLARYLQQNHGITNSDRVAIATERGLQRVVAIMATLKLGATYVPLTQEFPADRLAVMLQDCKAVMILTDQSTRGALAQFGSDVEHVSIDSPEIKAACQKLCDSDITNANIKPTDIAHIIYTSGSTGRPKGVLGSHGATFNRVQWMNQAFAFSPSERVAHLTSMAFIRGVWELFVPLCGGATLSIFSRDTVKEPALFIEQLQQRQISRVVTAPSLLRAICHYLEHKSDIKHQLKYWFVSGEALSTSLAKTALATFADTRLFNLYGSTEVLSDVLFYEVKRCAELGHKSKGHKSKGHQSKDHESKGYQSDDYIPLGKPITNVAVTIVSQQNHPVPDGVIGELVVTGHSVTAGYDGLAQLTAQQFIQTPVGIGYRTGDLAVKRSDGQVAYVGRTDHQIKVRGYRVELTEIEAYLNKIPAIKTAVVVARGEEDKQLAAYYTENSPISKSQLVDLLSQSLPSYMVPSMFMRIDEMPLTVNGKVNRKLLPKLYPVSQASITSEFIEIKTETEIALAPIWAKLLQLPLAQIGSTSNFFELGGHSLLSVRLVAEVRAEFNIELSIQDIFAQPILAALASFIEQQVITKALQQQRKSTVVKDKGWL